MASLQINGSPMQTASLTADVFNPGQDALDEDTTFAEVERRRLAARQAFLKADTDSRLRRAMNQNFRDLSDHTPAVGHKCWFWRVQGTGILQKSKWRGPARVVAHEHNDEKKLLVVWVVHGTHLMRCSPHQVRPQPLALRDLKHEPCSSWCCSSVSTGAGENVPAATPLDVHSRTCAGGMPLPCRDLRSALGQPLPPWILRLPVTMPAGPTSSLPVAAAPEQTPLPNDHENDDELCVEDVYVVAEGGRNNVPEGWVIVDVDFEMDQAWLAREVSERSMTVDQRAQMVEANKKELQSYFQNNVWEFTTLNADDKHRMVTARWVLTWKESENGTIKAKARLVLRGFEDPDVMSLEKASPTATKQAKFIILALAPILGWSIQCGDVQLHS